MKWNFKMFVSSLILYSTNLKIISSQSSKEKIVATTAAGLKANQDQKNKFPTARQSCQSDFREILAFKLSTQLAAELTTL
jgi:hypothetical protein